MVDLAIHIANIRPSLKDYWEATLNSLTLLEESIGKLAQFAVCNPRLKHIYTRSIEAGFGAAHPKAGLYHYLKNGGVFKKDVIFSRHVQNRDRLCFHN